MRRVRYIPIQTGGKFSKIQRGKNETFSLKQQTFSAALIVVVVVFFLVPGGSAREEESTWSFLPFVVVVVLLVSVDEVGRRPALLSRSSVIRVFGCGKEREKALPLGECVTSGETLNYNKKQEKLGKLGKRPKFKSTGFRIDRRCAEVDAKLNASSSW